MSYKTGRASLDCSDSSIALDAMSSNTAASIAATKSSNAPPQLNSQPQASPSLNTDGYSQRRNASLITPPSARNNQSLRKQHKGQRRPRFADEDAVAESVRLLVECIRITQAPHS